MSVGKDPDELLAYWAASTSTAFEHRPIPSATGLVCHMCNERPAMHKVGEEGVGMRHNFTAYVCCEDFGKIMGKLAQEWCAGEWPRERQAEG